MINSNKIINSKIIKTNNVFNDILLPLNKRDGFTNENFLIIPTYFYRYIGISKNEDDYYNNLYKLDKSLSNFENKYLKFTSFIPFNNNINILNKTANLWTNLEPFNDKKKKFLLSSIKLVKAFPLIDDSLIQHSVEETFSFIFNLYIKNSNNINKTKIKNFTLKILTWINEFIPILFKKINYNKNKSLYNPKIIYYGNIKKHEIYFLLFLSKIGCDILYINSYCDGSFSTIDEDNSYSNIIKFESKKPLKDFPNKEIVERTETVAFKASNELKEILYDENSGLYKPWQFDNYNIEAVTLKTTYDELKILWNEESRIRTGFKAKNGNIYIPNIFAKINGIPKDESLYWKDLYYFKSSPSTIFIDSLPFYQKNYSRQDLYRLSYLIDKNGFVNKNLLIKNNLYKFSYLKTSLQDNIIKKINDLFKLPLLKNNNEELKLKILISILGIDKKFIELIQSFDYPFKIPKIIIYNNDENIFNDEESILIAFLNLMGIDILILSPTAYNNIESQINQKYFDIHKLEKIKFNLELPNLDQINKKRNSFWSKLFKL